MARVRLMDQPKDFERFGIDPKKVEPWEDGRRDSDEGMHNEVWYFDALFDDQHKFMVGFRPKNPKKLMLKGDSPNLNIMITTPDGETKDDFLYYTSEESREHKYLV